VQYRVRRSASIAVLAVCSWACASAPSFPYAHGADSKGNPAPQHFLVLPLNLALPVPAGLEGTTDDVFSAIAGYLRDRGNSIETMSPEAALSQWHSSVGEVAASDTRKHDFETAMQVFIERARESTSFDAVITPALVFRETEIRKRKVKWDGVIRKYDIVNVSEEAKRKKIAGGLSPVFVGVSLHVMVFGVNGDSIFQGYGGLDLAHDLDLYGVEKTMRAQFALKIELLQNSKHLREGIAHAFDPYLPRN
jgi:menaquinone-dependent protoporphyrinogen IX oxidase